MSLQFYSEIRGSLNKHSNNDIDPETLKQLLHLFIKEKNAFEKLENKHPSYTERSLLSTLNGYTSTELFMSRLSPLEKENIVKLTNLMQRWFFKTNFKIYDFDTLFAIGSTTYPESYRLELENTLKFLDYNLIKRQEKRIYEEYNTSYEDIDKIELQKTINQRGNDIDLVLTWFNPWYINSLYSLYYEKDIEQIIDKKINDKKIFKITSEFIEKIINKENFCELIEIWDKDLFNNTIEDFESGNIPFEELEIIIRNNCKLTLSWKWKELYKEITTQDIKTMIIYKKYIQSREEFVRNTYLHKIIPQLLESNNIPFTIESQREDGSYYRIDHTHKTISKEKYLNPDQRKDWCLIIKFPDCRPIHLNVDTSTIQELYHHEQKYNSFFSILFHNLIEERIFLSTDWNERNQVPENLSIEEQIQYIRHNKSKIDWERIIEARKNQSKKIEDNDELPF